MASTQVSADQPLRAFLQHGSKKQGSIGCVGEILKYHKDCMEPGVFNKREDDVPSVDVIVNACGEDYTYTPEIAVAFHRLLVSSLLSYVFRLRIVAKAVNICVPKNCDPL